ncbi:beta strand repeat-containing protein [Halogeometricum luteum]|uniref:Ig-like domain (Group 3) n=1 Tax=Halogeometricum luteum TaxID=2950537 RepID=A0ABU2G1H6_9EURY|nr:hypothetical protein [Halogeometricum sp. S3BR5-2]MDS0294099.1 hypothetical protein [Halogeometricum sp. S3BR5-2]
MTYDEAVTVDTTDGTPTLEIAPGTEASYVSTDSNKVVFEYTVQEGDETELTLGEIKLNGGAIIDAANNNADTTTDAQGIDVSVDAVAPSIDGASVVSTDEDGVYVAGETIEVTVTYDEAVTVDTTDGTPTLDLGDVSGDANYASGSGSTQLVFSYDVSDGDEGKLTLGDISGGTLQDAAGNDADTTASAQSIDASVDAVDPISPSSITVQTKTPINSANKSVVDINVNFDSVPESGTVTLRVTDEDTGEVTDTVDTDGSESVSFTVDLHSLYDGQLTAAAKLTDDAGNENSSGFTAEQTFDKDTTAPSVSVESPSENDVVQSQDAISGTASASDIEAVELRIANGSKTWNGGEFTSTGTVVGATTYDAQSGVWTYDSSSIGSEGSYTITAIAIDTSGNSQSSSDVTYTIDNSIDTASIESLNETVVAAGDTIEVTYNANDVNYDSARLIVENSTEQFGSYDASNGTTVTQGVFAPNTAGEYTVRLEVNDTAENSNNESTKSFTVDTAAPNVSGVTLEAEDGDSVVTVGDTVTVTTNVSGQTDVASVDVDVTQFNNSAVTMTETDEPGVYSATFTVDESAIEGEQNVSVTVTDNVGNKDVFDSNSLTVDTNAPSFDFLEAHQTDGFVNVTFHVNETLDTNSIEVSIRDGLNQELGTVTSWTESDSTDHLYEGSYEIGNEETPYSANLTAASDVAGNAVSDPLLNDTIPVTSGVDISASGNVTTVKVTADEELKSFDIGLQSEQNLAESAKDDEIAAGVRLNQSQFDSSAEKVQSAYTYTYTYTYTVPRDGKFNATLSNVTAVGGSEPHGGVVADTDSVVVDTKAPSVVDAEIVDANGTRTNVSIQFDEPVSVSSPGIKLAGESMTNLDNDDSRQDEGVVYVYLPGIVATGDAPSLSVTGGVFERYDHTENTKNVVTTAPGGDLVDPHSWTTLDTHEYDLKKGVNFVSVPAEFGSLDIASSEFADMTIMTYDDGEWLTYNPEKPGDEQDFAELEGGQGYIVTTDADATVDVTVRNEKPGTTAEDATPSAQHLEEGWNLIGHWQEGSQSQIQALGTIGQSESTNVWEQNVAGSYGYDVASDFAPGHAYWVFVEDDEVYTASEYAQN